MGPTPDGGIARSRSVFISDVHLGFDGCRPEPLLECLRRLETQTLYLVGDILDLTCASDVTRWPAAHREVLLAILRIAERGTRVIYVPGNHDGLMRGFDGARLGKIEVHRECVHETADGRRFTVLHGDEFDPSCGRSSAWLERLGGRAYGALLSLNQKLDRLCRGLHCRTVPFASGLKQLVKSTVRRGDQFERAVVAAAQERGTSGLICGHFHRPEVREMDAGVLYCNLGDWVESWTALSEDFEGRLWLHSWRPQEERDAAYASEPEAARAT